MDSSELRVLMVASDRNIAVSGSAVMKRVAEYGGLLKELHIVLLCDKSHGLAEAQIAPNVWVHPTNSISRFMRPLDAVSKGKNLRATLISSQDPFECGWAGLKLKQKLNIPLEVQLHTDPFSPQFAGFLNSIRKVIAQKVVRGADSLRVVSQYLGDKVSKKFGFPMDKIYVMPIYVDRNRLDTGSAPFDLHDKFGWQFIMLVVARLTEEKDLPLALEVLQKVRAAFPNTGLVIVGAGPEENKLKSMAKKFGIEKNVAFVGWQEDLVWYYRTANLFLQTSNFEGYGLSLVEAGLSGLPVLTTAVGIANDLEDGKDALICPVGDVGCLCKGAQALIEDNSKRETLRMSLRDKLDLTLMGKDEYLKRMQEAWLAAASRTNI